MDDYARFESREAAKIAVNELRAKGWEARPVFEGATDTWFACANRKSQPWAMRYLRTDGSVR